MIATYRLQLTKDFRFAEARALVPYLARLGISHVYLSPVTESRPGSTHGYDVVDHSHIREELGGAAGFRDLAAAAREHGLQLILDIVPNHAGLGPKNFFWEDVLAYGPHSPYAPWFDIEWQPLKLELRNKVLLPFLGKDYGDALDAGELRVVRDNGRLYGGYFDHRFALSPATYADVLADVAASDAAKPRLDELRRAFANVNIKDHAAAEALIGQLGEIQFDVPELPAARVHAIFEKQFWRLANWRTASFEINYRRFFDINDLIGLRMEDPQVFKATHRLVKELLDDEAVAGVRIDHVDGLYDPRGYLERLRELGAKHVWVEKILAHDEALPKSWPVDGTTGYEFGAEVASVLTSPAGRRPLTQLYQQFTSSTQSFAEQAAASKHLMINTKLAGELNRLAFELDRLSESDYHNRDFTLDSLRDALAAIIASFGRYRTYLPQDTAEARGVIEAAVARAQARNPLMEPALLSFIGRMLLSEKAASNPKHAAWIGRFQQYTAPVTAKGIEDTAFYRYHRLAALNEVGGDPQAFGMSLRAFHRQAAARAKLWPRNLLATSTHDSKRGEDLRMRMLVLSEMPQRWRQTVRALNKVAVKHRRHQAPSRNDIYLFFQALAGLWHDRTPDLADRLAAYMNKAAREAKSETSWVYPHERYEKALDEFVRGMVADGEVGGALDETAEIMARFGMVNSVTQLILKTTSPGVPDFYRGAELLELSLVDPDNRRPVDFTARAKMLDEERTAIDKNDAHLAQRLATQPGAVKLSITRSLLALRRAAPTLFGLGSYVPLHAQGPRKSHALAFAREHAGAAIVIFVPRFSARLERTGGWGDTRLMLPAPLAKRTWHDVLSNQRIDTRDGISLSALTLPWVVARAE